MHIIANYLVIVLSIISSIFGTFNVSNTPFFTNEPEYKNANINSLNTQIDEAIWCASSIQPGQEKPTYTGNDCPAE